MHLMAITPGAGFEPTRWVPVLESGIDALLIREPQLDPDAVARIAAWCLETAPQVTVWVRGQVVPGCGLHLPESWLGEAPRGVPLSRPLHGEGDWEGRSHAEQLLISPIFPTPGKGEAWGRERLLAFLTGLPEAGPRLLALGSLTPEAAAGLRHPRLHGIAAIRAFWSGNPTAAVKAFRHSWA